jgi:hypothetical protein
MVKHDQRRAYYLALLNEIHMLVDYIVADKDATRRMARQFTDPNNPNGPAFFQSQEGKRRRGGAAQGDLCRL